jgi:hypothetical protein
LLNGCGLPLYSTTTVKGLPLTIPAAGVTTSSLPSARLVAACPSTVTSPATSRARSRLNADRSWVAVAVMVAVPPSCPVAGA